MSLPAPKAILFDWDNTLVDTWDVIHDASNHTLRAMGHKPWTMAETRVNVRRSMREAFPELFGERWKEAEKVFYDRFLAIHLDLLNPIAGSEDLLRCLSKRGIYLGVVSNKTGTYLREEAKQLGWNGFFAALIGAKDAEKDKPAPDPVHMALRGSGIEPGPHVWFVGDTDIDLVCAHAAGCLPVLLRPEAPEEGEFDDHPPSLHVSDAELLCRVVEIHWTNAAQ
ncbi:Phosphoglycolate phosphatase [Magnetospira sp. QH-2]|nr:Phosphoglycolate phosphatase [Magnetospira sp. QH-2]